MLLTLCLIYPCFGMNAPLTSKAICQQIAATKASTLPTRIILPKGVYHFKEDEAEQMHFYCSNHDHEERRLVSIPIVGLKNVEIDAQGSHFIFHGHVCPIVVMDSENITFRNAHISYAQDFNTEATIVAQSNGTTELEMSPHSSWDIKNQRFYNKIDQTLYPIQCAIAFHQNGRMVALGDQGDLPCSPKAEKISNNQVLFHWDSKSKGLQLGDILVLRNYARPHPSILLYRAKNTRLHDVVFHNSQGMALLAQRSENITIKGGGCIRQDGRIHTTQADATHFSNCRGLIDIQNATYEGMMDDAINVHSTCLGITQVHRPTEIVARYMHEQAIGFELFSKGESVQFIQGKTLENHPCLRKVKEIKKLNEREIRITLEEPLPDTIDVGDAIENACWYPSVLFCNNTIRNNRARGALFTTPKQILVRNNIFDHCSGSAILLAGDAQGWYESGRCLDISITENQFINNLASRYQFTEGIISIYPEVKQLQKQATPYHQNIRIENNVFITHRVPLLYSQSACTIKFGNNKVLYHDKYPPKHNGAPFIIKSSPEKQRNNEINAAFPLCEIDLCPSML